MFLEKTTIKAKKDTSKSFSEALILASVKSYVTHNMTRYCSFHCKKNTSSEHVVYKNWVFLTAMLVGAVLESTLFLLTFKTIFVHT